MGTGAGVSTAVALGLRSGVGVGLWLAAVGSVVGVVSVDDCEVLPDSVGGDVAAIRGGCAHEVSNDKASSAGKNANRSFTPTR